MKTCSKCGSEKIAVGAKVLDKGESNANYYFNVAVDEQPDALIFKRRSYSTVYANICGDCGFIEFYADNPQELYETYLRSQENL